MVPDNIRFRTASTPLVRYTDTDLGGPWPGDRPGSILRPLLPPVSRSVDQALLEGLESVLDALAGTEQHDTAVAIRKAELELPLFREERQRGRPD